MIAGKATILKPINSLEISTPNIFKKDTQATNVELSKNSEIKIDLKIDDQPVNNIDTLIKMYPNHICIYKDDTLYATPILVGDLDLKLLKLEKNDFEKMFKHFQNIFKNSVIKITEESSSEIYNKYISIIDEPEKNIDLIFSINLFVLMKYNCYEDFYQISIPGLNTTTNQKGGMKLWEKFKKLITTTQDEIQDELIGTGGSGIIETGINIADTFISLEAINFTFGNPVGVAYGNPVGVAAIGAATIIAHTVGLRNVMNGIGKVFRKGLDITEKVLPILLSSKINSGIEKVSINLDTLVSYNSMYNLSISSSISEQLRRQYAEYTSRNYTNSITKITPTDYAPLRQQIIDFQTAQGYLTPEFTKEIVELVDDDASIVPLDFISDDELRSYITTVPPNEVRFTEQGKTRLNQLNIGQRKFLADRIIKLFPDGIPPLATANRVAAFAAQLKDLKLAPIPKKEKREYKTLMCNICSNNFKFFPEDGYIHQVFYDGEADDEFAEMLKKHPTLAKLRKPNLEVLRRIQTTALTYYNKLNIFPCKQFIETLTPQQKADESFSINGKRLMCSKCCLISLAQLEDSTWPLWSETKDNIFSIDKVQDLIKDLTPNELYTKWSKQYNKNRLLCAKFNQIKLNRKYLEEASNKIRAENPNISEGELNGKMKEEIKIVECPRCKPTVNGKLYRVFQKKDIELLYLHCNACGLDFNGCDLKSPYLINKKQFSRFLASTDICEFFEGEKMLERRQDCFVRVRLDVFKRIKQAEIFKKWNEKFKKINEISLKKCPRCKTVVENAQGCSAMQCNTCQETFCYICSQKVNGNGGHDATHFLVNIAQPYGSWYGAQCVNVNFTTIDPDGKPGIHFPEKQNGKSIRPNKQFEMLTKITWKKFNYLIEKYTKQRINPLSQLSSAGMWGAMDKVHYNPDHNVCYETGDLTYDPDVLGRNEYKEFVTRCDLGEEKPYLHGSMVDESEILEILDPGFNPDVAPAAGVATAGVATAAGVAAADIYQSFNDDEQLDAALLQSIIDNAPPGDAALMQAEINNILDNPDRGNNGSIGNWSEFWNNRKGLGNLEEDVPKPVNEKPRLKEPRLKEVNVIRDEETIEKAAKDAKEAKVKEIALRKIPLERERDKEERDRKEYAEVIEAIKQGCQGYIEKRPRVDDTNHRQYQARIAREQAEIEEVLRKPGMTNNIPDEIRWQRGYNLHKEEEEEGEKRRRELLAGPGVKNRKIIEEEVRLARNRHYVKQQQELKERNDYLKKKDYLPPQLPKKDDLPRKPLPPPPKIDDWSLPQPLPKEEVKKPVPGMYPIELKSRNKYRQEIKERQIEEEENKKRYDEAISEAKKYFDEKRLADPNDPKLPYLKNGIKGMKAFREEGKKITQPMLEVRGVVSNAVLQFYCDLLKSKGYTSICFHKSHEKEVFVILKDENDKYYQSFNYERIRSHNINIKHLKCLEIKVEVLSRIVDMYNFEVYGEYYRIDFNGIINDQSAVNYIYKNLSRWFPRGGNKILTKKNIKQKKYIKTKNNKKKPLKKTFKLVKKGKKSKKAKYLNN